MKKKGKIIAGVILSPIILFLLLSVLFYLPVFQNWAVRQATSIASEKTGMDISVSHVRLSFPLDIAIEGVRVIKHEKNRKDTIAIMQHAIADVRLLPLFCSEVEIDELTMSQLKFNTSNLVASAVVRGSARKISLASHGIELNNSLMHLDDVVLDGANVSVEMVDTVLPEDTSETKNPWKIELKALRVRNSDIRVH